MPFHPYRAEGSSAGIGAYLMWYATARPSDIKSEYAYIPGWWRRRRRRRRSPTLKRDYASRGAPGPGEGSGRQAVVGFWTASPERSRLRGLWSTAGSLYKKMYVYFPSESILQGVTCAISKRILPNSFYIQVVPEISIQFSLINGLLTYNVRKLFSDTTICFYEFQTFYLISQTFQICPQSPILLSDYLCNFSNRKGLNILVYNNLYSL